MYFNLIGGFNVVKFGDAIDVKGIISLVTSRLAVGTRHYRNLYAMRLHHPGSGESYWLHQDTTMYQVFNEIIYFNDKYILDVQMSSISIYHDFDVLFTKPGNVLIYLQT